MSSIVVSGDTSGAITIAAPAVAGTNTLTLPASTGTVALNNGPAFSAYLATAQQSITSATWTKVTLNAEEFDTNNNFDSTTNYRFTPTVAGYYQINGAFITNGTGATQTSANIAIYKNGSAYKYGGLLAINTGSVSQTAQLVTSLVYFNGSTDYVELYGNIAQTSPFFYFGSTYTYMNGIMVRAA